jgi:hypothetical protein
MGNGDITPHVPNFFSGLMYWSWFLWKVEWFVHYDGCKDFGRKRSWPVWDTTCVCWEELRRITMWFKVACYQAEIRSWSLPHTSQKRHLARYADRNRQKANRAVGSVCEQKALDFVRKWFSFFQIVSRLAWTGGLLRVLRASFPPCNRERAPLLSHVWNWYLGPTSFRIPPSISRSSEWSVSLLSNLISVVWEKNK